MSGWGEFLGPWRVKSLTRSMAFRKVGAALGETNRVFEDSQGVASEEGAIRPISTFEGLGAKAQTETHLP